ncbi:hypothetical protein KR009_001716 [Drosophila setifemur]|nr:hypothetical protein KR009_001716 [Drosophila setifemur]
MSDNDDGFMCDDDEDYGLEYSEDSNSEPDVDLENQYYNSKALMEEEPDATSPSCRKYSSNCTKAVKTVDGEDDLKKGTQLLEIYALEIEMYTVQKNNRKLKALYEQSLHIKSAIPHPLIMGVIHECGGKMHLREGEFEKAHTDSLRHLKTTMTEAKPYKNDPKILAMTNLVNSYQNNDINEFKIISRQHRSNIMADQFIREHIEDLLRNIRTQVLIKLIRPYKNIAIPLIANALNIEPAEVESLLVSCIRDDKIKGRIDQVNQVFQLDKINSSESLYNALEKWSNQIQSLQFAVVQKMA